MRAVSPLLILSLALLPGCRRTENPQPPPPAAAAEGVIVALGDSLTAGHGLPPGAAYPALLQARLEADGRHWKVINAGVSGETSGGTRSRVDWILRMKPDIVVVEIGANDGMRGLDPGLLRRNLVEIVARLQAGGATVVLGGMRMLTNLGRDYTDAFEAVYPAAAKETGAALIPFFLEGVAGVARLNQEDGIHPTAEGHRIIMETVYPHVAAAIDARRQ